MLTRHSTELTDPGVVPSLADRWSHHTGGTHLKVVPCHWRATISTAKRRCIRYVSKRLIPARTNESHLVRRSTYLPCSAA